MSPTATTCTSLPSKPCSAIARKTRRPMRPNPLIATFTAIFSLFSYFGVVSRNNREGMLSLKRFPSMTVFLTIRQALAFRAGIKSIAQPISNEIHGQQCDDQHRRGKYQQPPVNADG